MTLLRALLCALFVYCYVIALYGCVSKDTRKQDIYLVKVMLLIPIVLRRNKKFYGSWFGGQQFGPKSYLYVDFSAFRPFLNVRITHSRTYYLLTYIYYYCTFNTIVNILRSFVQLRSLYNINSALIIIKSSSIKSIANSQELVLISPRLYNNFCI